MSFSFLVLAALAASGAAVVTCLVLTFVPDWPWPSCDDYFHAAQLFSPQDDAWREQVTTADCSWTEIWPCPPTVGLNGSAQRDGSLGFYCCCGGSVASMTPGELLRFAAEVGLAALQACGLTAYVLRTRPRREPSAPQRMVCAYHLAHPTTTTT